MTRTRRHRKKINILRIQADAIYRLRKQNRRLKELEKENLHLKEVLYVCGEIAVTSFEDMIVGLVDRTLNGFRIPESRFKEIWETQKKPDTGDMTHDCTKDSNAP